MGKGSNRRPPQISPAEEDLRYALAYGEIDEKEFNRRFKQLKKEGKIYRRIRWK